MTAKQKLMIADVLNVPSFLRVWGIWDTQSDGWVWGQNSLFYETEKAAKLGRGQKFSYKTNHTWEWKKLSWSDRQEMKKIVSKEYKKRYEIRQVYLPRPEPKPIEPKCSHCNNTGDLGKNQHERQWDPCPHCDA